MHLTSDNSRKQDRLPIHYPISLYHIRLIIFSYQQNICFPTLLTEFISLNTDICRNLNTKVRPKAYYLQLMPNGYMIYNVSHMYELQYLRLEK